MAGIVPDFETNRYEYDLTIPSSINNIEILAVPENPKSILEITGNNGLKQGLNLIEIKVISEDKMQEEIYKINVTKTENLELANTNLEILAIENNLLTPAFESNIIQYSTDISNDTTKLNIFAVPENEQGKIEITGNDNLKEGNNTITITVTAPNGISKREYKINAYKRNLKEEGQYKMEQDEQVEKLKQAYEIESLSSTNKEIISGKIKQKAKDNNYFSTIGTIILLIAIATIGIIYYRKKKR